jgi:citronellol/citronellal dehydrogenase
MTVLRKNLQGLTAFITGGSRGIGRAIALKFAAEGANVVIASKTSEPHPKLPGTIHTVAREVEANGGKALPIALDVRDANAVEQAMRQAADHFGGIDILVNNAGAISLSSVEKTAVKRFDLMMSVNARAVFVCSQAALPYLKASDHAHILSMSPAISLASQWLAPHAPYTLSKYGMTLLSMGMAEEFRPYGIGVNCLWPKTIIATAAIAFAVGDETMLQHARKPDIMADAAFEMVRSEPATFTGQTLLDETILRRRGYKDFEHYRYAEGTGSLHLDLFVDWS